MRHTINTPAATYHLIIDENRHFAIDCSCKGKEGVYHGSHYEKTGTLEQRAKEHSERDHRVLKQGLEHTFYMNESLFNITITHHEERTGTGIVIICNDCNREFPFTITDWNDLITRLERRPDQRS